MTTTDTVTLCGREQQTQCVQNTGPYFSVTVQQTRSRCATQPHDYNRHGHAVLHSHMTTTDTATLCGREQQTQCVQNTGPYFSVTVQQTRSRCATQPHDYNRHGHAVWKRTANTVYKTLAPTSLSLSNRHGHAVLHSHMSTTDTVTLCGREQQTQCVQNTGPYFSVTVQQTRSRCATQPHDYNRHCHAVLHSHMTTTDTATLCYTDT